MGMAVVAETGGRLAIAADDYLGETPVWSTTEQALYWVNCEDPPRLRRWAPGSDEIKSWPMPDRLGGMALRRDGDPIVCTGPAVYNLNASTGELSLIARSPFPDYVKLHESSSTARAGCGSACSTCGSARRIFTPAAARCFASRVTG